MDWPSQLLPVLLRIQDRSGLKGLRVEEEGARAHRASRVDTRLAEWSHPGPENYVPS